MWRPATLPLLLLLARPGGAVRDEGNGTATTGVCPRGCLQCCGTTLFEAGFNYAGHFKCVLRDGDTAAREGCGSPRPRSLWKGQYKSICPLEPPEKGFDETCEPVVLEAPAEAADAGSALAGGGVGTAGPLVLKLDQQRQGTAGPLVLKLEAGSWLGPAGSGDYANITGGFSAEVSVPFRDSTKPLKLRVGGELAAVVRFEDGHHSRMDDASIIYGTRPPFKSSKAEESSTGNFSHPVYKWARVAPDSATGLSNLFNPPHIGIYMVTDDGTTFRDKPAFEFEQDSLSHQPTVALQVDEEGKRHPVARFASEGSFMSFQRTATVLQGVDAALVLLGELALLRTRVLSDG